MISAQEQDRKGLALPVFIASILLILLSVADGQDTVHFVVNDHVTLVHAHAGLCQDLHRLGSHCAVDTDLCAAVGLVASTALVCADALLLAVQNKGQRSSLQERFP